MAPSDDGRNDAIVITAASGARDTPPTGWSRGCHARIELVAPSAESVPEPRSGVAQRWRRYAARGSAETCSCRPHPWRLADPSAPGLMPRSAAQPEPGSFRHPKTVREPSATAGPEPVQEAHRVDNRAESVDNTPPMWTDPALTDPSSREPVVDGSARSEGCCGPAAPPSTGRARHDEHATVIHPRSRAGRPRRG